jgi:hypothetical protein
MQKTLFAFGCAAIMLFAADPWKDKKPSDWSAQDAKRILMDSPWADKVTAQMDFSRMEGGPGRGIGEPGGAGGPGIGGARGGIGGPGEGGAGGGIDGPGGAGPGGGPGRGMGRPGGGMERPGGMEPPQILVRWESAAPVREAAAKLEDTTESKMAEVAREYYIISTSGTPMRGRPGRDQQGQEQARSQPDMSRMQERLLQVTSLKIKGKDSLAPAKVEVLQTDSGLTTLFLFPRTREITLDDKEVTFETSMGPMQVKSKFALKKMMFNGQLAL